MFGDNELKCSKCYDRKAKRAELGPQNAVIATGRKEGKLQMLLSLRENGLTYLFKELLHTLSLTLTACAWCLATLAQALP